MLFRIETRYLLGDFSVDCAFCVLYLSLPVCLEFIIVFVEIVCLLKVSFSIELFVSWLNLFGGFYVAFLVI